jgi:hypothetical protein
MLWAAPQAPEKITNHSRAKLKAALRLDISLILAQITRKPSRQELAPIIYKRFSRELTRICDQIGGNNPASFSKAVEFVRDSDQGSAYNSNFHIDQKRTYPYSSRV